MSIPDPTIDPITGLPIFDASGIVQQIPLGNQTTDFASWNATAQPTRGPLFPDDGFPVFTNTQGQHPQSGNAQSIQSDGNHALKVSVVNPGGGSSPTPKLWQNTGGTTFKNFAGTGIKQSIDTIYPPITALVGYFLNIRYYMPTAADDQNCWYIIRGINGSGVEIGPEITLYHMPVMGFPAAYYPASHEVNQNVQFTVPIDPNITWPGFAHLELYASDNATYVLGNGSLYYY